MSKICERYGLSNKAVTGLWQKWTRMGKAGRSWRTFEEFVSWCCDTGYDTGMDLKKRDNNAPHGPTNSYWYRWEKIGTAADGPKESGCRFCAKCVVECPSGNKGCQPWREWFIQNWNKNIYASRHTKLRELRASRPGVFVYEHPDLIREGIV